MKTLEASVRSLCRKVEFGDALWFFYLLVLTRQYLWAVNNNVLAWILTCAFAFSLWCLVLREKEEPPRNKRLSYSFCLIVALPLFAVYALRFAFPDYSFDVLNYHMLFAQRSLRGWPTSPSFFLPSLNPLPDMLTGIYRHILGYRLGTIVNYLTLIWVAIILAKILRTYIKRAWVIHLAVLLIVLTEGLLFQINNYIVDLLALPLLLQAIYLILYAQEPQKSSSRQFYIAFLLGMSVALKLTNLFVVIPLAMVWAQRVLSNRFKLRPTALLILLLSFVAPLIPHSIQLHREGSHALPFYANVVKSPMAFTKLKESRWGPVGLEEALIWPALLYAKPERLSELTVYAGKIPVGFILALFVLPVRRIDRNIRALSFIVVAGALLWSLTSGYSRYACGLELLSGLLIVYLCWLVGRDLKTTAHLKRTLSLIPWSVLAILSSLSLYYTFRYEWSLRPTLLGNPRAYLNECQFLFRDYSLRSFLSPEKAALFDNVEMWIVSAQVTSGFEGLLRPDIPVISAARYTPLNKRDGPFQGTPDPSNKRMFSLGYLQHLGKNIDVIRGSGLGIGQITAISLPYYSYYNAYKLVLIEVLPSVANETKGGYPIFSSAGRPLPAAAFRASISSQRLLSALKAESKATVYLMVKNMSSVSWPGQGGSNGAYKVNLGNHWLDRSGKVLIYDDDRTGLPFDLPPGDEIELPLTVTVPGAPGDYILEMDMVQEQVTWFAEMGSITLRANIKVE